MIDFNSVILPALFAVGYWGIGFLESQLGSTTEPFDFKKTARTLASGLVVGFVQAFAGLQVDPASVTTFAAFDGILVLALNKFLNLYSSTSSSGSATTAAPVTTAVAAAAAGPASMVLQPAGYPTPLYSTSFKMRDTTKEYLRLAITDPTDWANVQAQIAAAEAKNLGDYIITWSHSRWAHIHFGLWMATNGQATYISEVIGGAFDDSQGIPKPA